LFAALYFVAGRLGLEFTYYHETATLVIWPPVGLSLTALILFGRRLWPGILVGSVLVNIALPLTLAADLGIAIGSTLEAWVGVTLLTRVAGFRPSFERMQDGVAFLLIGVLGCTTISATMGASSTILSGFTEPARFAPVWVIWWMSDLGSALVLTPILLILVHGTPSWKTLAGKLETWLATATVIATSGFAFFGPDLGLLGFAASFFTFTPLVWAGTRLGTRGAMVASFLIISSAMIATGLGRGPFVLGSTTEAMFLLWPYSVLVGITAFALATVAEQHNAADRKYHMEEAERRQSEKAKLLLLERKRLTRDMHDGLGGQLVSVLAMVERGLAAPGEVAESVRRAIDDIRIVIDSLDPDTTDLPTTLGKLRARLEPLLRRNGIALAWRVDDAFGADDFAPEAVLHILRIIQEAATNALRHAKASRIEINLTLDHDEPQSMKLSIRDDGRGLPAEMSIGGRGIRNMKSRARVLGAGFRIDPSESGTRVDLTIPIPLA